MTGCAVLEKLWTEAYQDCSVHTPGIIGSPDRGISFVKCDNMQWAMSIAMMECWREKNNKGGIFPLFVEKIETRPATQNSADNSKK